MYARLWWKEARMFWPLWAVLGVVAAGVQGVLLWAGLPQVRNGVFIAQGVGWSILYAFAVGAAALAGEREASTQLFLDTLPVSRRMLWTSKASFGLATTLGLALGLAALGALGTTAHDPVRYPYGAIAVGFGAVLIEGVGWSSLWSVLLRSTLHAATLGLITVLTLNMVLARTVVLWDPVVLAPTAPLRLALAIGAAALSGIVYTRGPRPDQAASALVPPRTVVRRPRRRGEYRAMVHRLAWETARESRTTWLLLAGAAAGVCLAAWLESRHGDAILWATCMSVLLLLLAGVSVFGTANRTCSYRFLAQHGVGPGAVWTTRVLVWGTVVSGLLFVSTLVMTVIRTTPQWNALHGGPLVAIREGLLASGFALGEVCIVGLFCGQVLKRTITAWVVACVAFLLLVVPQFGLALAGMIPPWGVALFPALLLAISRAWTRDWMNDLRGPARWLRLASMVSLAAVLLAALYIGYRAWSVPLIDPPIALTAAPAAAPLAPGEDAADDYTQILLDSSRIKLRAHIADHAFWSARRELIPRLWRAAAKPEARFTPRASWDSQIDPRLRELGSMVALLGLDSTQRCARGDLAGAWNDLVAGFRMTAQMSRGGALKERTIALEERTEVFQSALAWAADPHQTPAQLRAALAGFRALPPLAPFSDCLRAEYALIARTLRHSPGAPYLLGKHPAGVLFARDTVFMIPPVLFAPAWEHERTRRVLHLWLAEQLALERLDPWERNAKGARQVMGDGYLWRSVDLQATRRGSAVVIRGSEVDHVLTTTLLAGDFWWSAWATFRMRDQEAVLSRAFEQVIALRIWQLEHAGEYPDSLAALVPGLLPRLPRDPYSGQPYRYRRIGGQALVPHGQGGLAARDIPPPVPQPTRPGQSVLYSVGPNVNDDSARSHHEPGTSTSDFIFPLPDSS